MTVKELRQTLFEFDDDAYVAITDNWEKEDIDYIGQPEFFMAKIAGGGRVVKTLVIDLGR